MNAKSKSELLEDAIKAYISRIGVNADVVLFTDKGLLMATNTPDDGAKLSGVLGALYANEKSLLLQGQDAFKEYGIEIKNVGSTTISYEAGTAIIKPVYENAILAAVVPAEGDLGLYEIELGKTAEKIRTII